MEADEPKEISLILKDWSSGNRDAVNRLLPMIYDEFKKISAQNWEFDTNKRKMHCKESANLKVCG